MFKEAATAEMDVVQAQMQMLLSFVWLVSF